MLSLMPTFTRCFSGLFLALSLASSAQQGIYQESYRPQIHYSPRVNWTNDPNGLVYFEGEYHLFYQYNPLGNTWGHMSWGHAVSKDLLHWEELPVALPEENGEMIYTGSVVVDRKNTSRLCLQGKPCLVAVYTGSRAGDKEIKQRRLQVQDIAVSNDRGRTWQKYEGNPVLDLHMTDFRDPSVFWNEARQKWIMTVALSREHKVVFYSSSNLKHWEQESAFGPEGSTGGVWECPNLLSVPSASGKDAIWLLNIGLNRGAPAGGSGTQYFFGNFDGKEFKTVEGTGANGWVNYGKDDYCAIPYNGLPASQKPVLIGWMNNWEYARKVPTSPWRGQFSIPRELSYIKDADGYALVQHPLIGGLRAGKPRLLSTRHDDLGTIDTPSEIHFHFSATAQGRFGIRLQTDETHWTDVVFDKSAGTLELDRTHSGTYNEKGYNIVARAPISRRRAFDMQLLIDTSSIEVFAQNGTVMLTDLVFPVSQKTKLVLLHNEDVKAGTILRSGSVQKMRSIWQKK